LRTDASVTKKRMPSDSSICPEQFENPSFCPPEGSGAHGDPELNRRKNRIDDSAAYNPVDFAEIKTLSFPASVGGKDRSAWTASERAAIEQSEGIPIAVEGFLALVNNAHQGQPPKIQGARPEGGESCNCGQTASNRIDFHVWLLNAAGDNRKDAIVVEMTPRVRAHHPKGTLANLTNIANHHFRVRISGWLMMDGQHPEQLGATRATLWEIHPIMKLEYKQGNTWRTL